MQLIIMEMNNLTYVKSCMTAWEDKQIVVYFNQSANKLP